MKKWLFDNKKIVVFVIYAIVTFGLLFIHRNWRDEAQAWLIARDCSILEMISTMKYEGHMLLWSLILLPFAKLGFPYMTTNIVSWVIMCITVWLILEKAPFSFKYRILLIMFFPVWYLYPAISRCYCLVPLATVLMAINYRNRKENPKLFLLSLVVLANTHVIMFGMVGIVLLDYLVELFFDVREQKNNERAINNKAKATQIRRKNKEDIQKRFVWFAITVGILFLSVLPLLGCLSTNICVKHNVKFMEGLKSAFIDWSVGLIRQSYMLDLMSTPCRILLTWVIGLALIIALVLEIRKHLGAYLKILASVIYQLLIYAFIYYGSAQRGGTIIFIVLYYKWIECYNLAKDTGKPLIVQQEEDFNLSMQIVKGCYIVLILLSILGGFFYMSKEINYKASYAYEMGDYINNNLKKYSVILSANREEFTSAIVPYTKKDVKYYNVTGMRYFTYTTWDMRNYIQISKEHIKYLKQRFGNNDNLYYLYRRTNSNNNYEIEFIKECIENEIFTGLYATHQNSYNQEYYILYKVNLN